jgi:hypothetical protein
MAEYLYRRLLLARDLLTEDGVLLVPSTTKTAPDWNCCWIRRCRGCDLARLSGVHGKDQTQTKAVSLV